LYKEFFVPFEFFVFSWVRWRWDDHHRRAAAGLAASAVTTSSVDGAVAVQMW